MPAPLLLVDDDLATIAQVKRLLARDGYEVVLATNAADAVIAWGHHMPRLVIINPKVESDRGGVVLDELRSHPDAQLLHVLILGETLPGYGYPVAELPLDPETFASTVNELVQGTSSGDGWQVHVAPTTRTDEIPAVEPETGADPDAWRATRRSPAPGREEQEEAPIPAPAVSPPSADLEASLFGDLEAQVANDVEAQAMASVDAELARIPLDQELQALEDDVRAEAARRREKRQTGAAPKVGLPTPDRKPAAVPEVSAAPSESEEAFAGFDAPAQSEGASDEPAAGAAETDDAVAARLQADSQTAKATLQRAEEIARAALAAQQATAQHAADRAATRQAELEAERKAAQQALEQAQALARAERVERERVEEELRARGNASEGEAKQLWSEVERLETELKDAGLKLRDRAERSAALELQLSDVRDQLKQRSETAAQLELDLAQARGNADVALREALAKVEVLTADQARSTDSAEALATRLAQARERSGELEAALETARQEAGRRAEELVAALAQKAEDQDELHAQSAADIQEVREQLVAEHTARTAALEKQRAALEAQLAVVTSQSDELSAAAQRAAGDLREAVEEAEQSEARALSEAAVSAEAIATARAETEAMRQRSVEAEAGLEQVRAEVEKLRQDFEASHVAQRNLEEAMEDARAANLEVRMRAEQAEAKVRQLEEKAVLPLKIPHRPALAVTRYGTLDLGELARLVGQVVMARAEIRLELAAPGGRRTVWLSRGAVTAAESSFGGESLLDRARRDGLIDGRQAAELHMVRSATPAETIVVLKERGFLREAEVVPLVQRYTEQVALDAFSEPTSEYRLAEESPGNETLVAVLPRPTLPLLAEALRRALPVDELLQRLGGSGAVPASVETELDLRALGFADKERRMLGYCDGEANVEDLALASGLKADVAFRALLVAKLLGLIELKVPTRIAVAPSPQLDVRRLDAKYEQVQDADYFTMLGVGRTAGGDEVLRAWQRLAEEFDPIKYSGHPDAGLQQRAQVVYTVLEEAAKALGDDRRRAEYARHLVD